MANVTSALGKKFTFSIANATGATKVIAIFAALFNTLAVSTVTTTTTTEVADVNTSVSTSVSTISFSSAAAINTAGFAADYVMDDGTVVTNLTCTAIDSEKTIREFREYVKHIGGQITKMTIQANNSDVFDKAFKITRCTPLEGTKTESFQLAPYYSEYQQSSTKVTIDNLNLVVDCDTLMTLPIDTGRTVTITLYMA